MKKVGKEFRKSLSAILAASMVMGSMPQTSLMVNAEEAEPAVETEVETAEETIAENEAAPEEDGEGIEENEAVVKVSVTMKCDSATAEFDVFTCDEDGSNLSAALNGSTGLGNGDSVNVDPNQYIVVKLKTADASRPIQKTAGGVASAGDVVYGPAKITENKEITIEAPIITHAVNITNEDNEDIKYAFVTGTLIDDSGIKDTAFTAVSNRYVNYSDLTTDSVEVEAGKALVLKVREGVTISNMTAVKKLDTGSKQIDTDYDYDYYYVIPSADVNAVVTKPEYKTVTIRSLVALDSLEVASHPEAEGEVSNENNCSWKPLTPKYTKAASNDAVFPGKNIYVYTAEVVSGQILHIKTDSGVKYGVDAAASLSLTSATEVATISADKTINIEDSASYTISSSEDLIGATDTPSGTSAGTIATITYTGVDTTAGNKFGKNADIDVKVAAKSGYTITRVYADQNGKITELGTAAGTYKIKGGTDDIEIHVEGYQDAKFTVAASGFDVKISDKVDGEYVAIDTAKKYIAGRTYYLKVSSSTKAIDTVTYDGGNATVVDASKAIYSFSAAAASKAIAVTAAAQAAPVSLSLKNAKVYYQVATSAPSDTSSAKILSSDAKFIPAVPSGSNNLYIKVVADSNTTLSKQSVKYDGSDIALDNGWFKITELNPKGSYGTYGTNPSPTNPDAKYSDKKTISITAEAAKTEINYYFVPMPNVTYTLDSTSIASTATVIDSRTATTSIGGKDVVVVKGYEGEDIRLRVDVSDSDYKLNKVFSSSTWANAYVDNTSTPELAKDTSKNFVYTLSDASTGTYIVATAVSKATADAVTVKFDLSSSNASHLDQYFAYVNGTSKKLDETLDDSTFTANDDSTHPLSGGVSIRNDQTLKIAFQDGSTADDHDYVLDYATYKNKDGETVKVTPDSKNRIAIPVSSIQVTDGNNTPDDVTDDTLADVVIYEKINTQKAVNVTFTGLDDTLNTTNTKYSGAALYSSSEWTTQATTIVADGTANAGKVEIEAATGYVIKSITVNGTAEAIAEDGLAAGAAHTIQLDISAKKDYSIVVKTAPAKSVGDKYAQFSGVATRYITVEQNDKVTFSKSQNIIWVEEGADTITFSIDANEGVATANKRVASVVVDSKNATLVSRTGSVFTYEIPASWVTGLTKDKNDATPSNRPNAITIATEADSKLLYLPAGADVYVDYKDDGYDMTLFGTAGQSAPSTATDTKYTIANGKKVTIHTETYEKLLQYEGKDALNNDIWTPVNMSTIVKRDKDDKITDTYNEYTFTINDSNTDKNHKLEFKVEGPEALAHTISATLNGASVAVSDDGLNTVKEINAKAGDAVILTVDSASNGYTIDALDLSSSGIETKFTCPATSDTVTFTISEKDAGKDIVLPLTTTPTSGDTAKVDLGVVTIHVSALAAGIEVRDVDNKVVESGSEIKMTSGTKVEYAISSLPANLDPSLYKLETKAAVGTAPGAYTYNKATGEFVYYAPYTEGTAEFVWVSTDSSRKELYKLSITTAVPELEIGGLTQASVGTTYANIVLTPDKNLVKGTANLFYKVVSEPVAGTDKPASAVKKVAYVPVDFDKDGNPVATSYKMTVANTPASADDLEKIAWNYKLTASLVLAKDDLAEETNDVTSFYKQGKEVTLDVATKNAYFEDNLSLKLVNKTAYTGQEIQIAQMVYSDKASGTDNSKASFVLIDANGGSISADGKITDAGEVIVTVPNYIKTGKYTLEVRAEAAEGMYQSRAKVNFTVKNGINEIRTSTPAEYAFNASKGAKYSIKPVGYTKYYTPDKGRVTKADKQKFTYELVNVSGISLEKDNSAYAKNVLSNVKVDKNGNVKVSKSFEVTGAETHDTIYVKVKANDFNDGNETRFDIVRTKLTADKIKAISEVYFVNGNTNITEATTLDKINGASIVVKDDTGRDITDFVNLTVSGGFWKYDDNTVVIKDGKKPTSITVKATTTDGSKKSKSFKIKLTPVQAASVEIAPINATITKTSDDAYTYKGSDKTNPLAVNIQVAKKEIDARYYNLQTKVKGGILVTDSKSTDTVSIIPTAAETTVTVTDKSVKKGEKATITLTNTAYEAVKAPKAKLAKGEVLYAGSTNIQSLTYNVATDYNAVQLVETKRSDYNKVIGAWLYDAATETFDDNMIVEIKDGKMKLEFTPNNGSKTGTITYKAIYGNVDATTGVFTPATKAAEIKVSVKKLKEFKAVTDYTINYLDSTIVPFTGTPAAALVSVDELESANVNGKPNKFATYFKVNSDGKIELNLDSIDDFTKVEDKDLTGYVTYTCKSAKTDRYVVKTTPITVKLDTAFKTYDVASRSVMKKSGAMRTTATLKLDGKDIDVKAIKAITTGWSADINPDGSVTFTTSGSYTEIGNNTVEFKMVPSTSYFGKDVDTATRNIDKNGVTVTAIVNVLDPATATGKITSNEDKLTVKLADGTQSYTNSKGFYASKEIQVVGNADAKDDVLAIIPSELDIRTIKLGKDAPEGIAVEYVGNNLTFTAQEDKITAKSEIKVPVEVQFDNSSVAEEVTFTLVTPDKFKTVADVAADVKAYIESNGLFYEYVDKNTTSAYVGTTTTDGTTQKTLGSPAKTIAQALADGINDVLTKDAATGASIKGSVDYVDGRVSVTIAKGEEEQVLTDIAIDKDIKLGAQKTADDVLDDVTKKAVWGILDEGTVTSETTADAVKELYANIDYMEVSEKTTAYDVQAYLQKAVANTDYTVAVKDFEITKTTKLDQGSVSFKIQITAKGQVAVEGVNISASLKEYVRPE